MTVHEMPWEYAFPAPVLDTQPDFRLQPPGSFSLLSGVDARYRGALKRFPGFKLLTAIPGTIDSVNWIFGGGTPGVFFFQGFTIQKDVTSSDVIRGVMFLAHTGSGASARDYLMACYSIEGGTVTGDILYDFGASRTATYIDVTNDHRNIWMVARASSGTSKVAKTIRYTTNSNSWVDMDSTHQAPTMPTQTPGTGGSLTLLGTYGTAYRFVLPEQGIYGPLSNITEVTLTGSNNKISADLDPAGASGFLTSNIDTFASRVIVQLFRTVADTFPTTGARGQLYLDHEHEMTVDAGPAWDAETVTWGATSGGGTSGSDLALVYNQVLDPDEQLIFKPNPQAKRIEVHEGLLFLGCAWENANDRRDAEVLRWSPTERDRPNLIDIRNRRRPGDLSDRLLDIEKAGSFLAAIYENSIVRLHRSGSRVAVDEIDNRHGSVGRLGHLALSNKLFVVSPLGLLVCDLTSGEVSVLEVTQHWFDSSDNWRDSLGDVESAYDASMGTAVFLNPTTKEAILIWMNQDVMTILEELPWAHVTTGVDFLSGGQKRAIYVPAHLGAGFALNLYVADEDYSGDSQTTMGTIYDALAPYNNTAVTGSTSTSIVTASTGTLSAPLPTQHYLRFVSGNLVSDGPRAITGMSESPTTYTTAAFSGAPANGDRFTVGLIPLRFRAWPLTDERGQVNLTKIKKVNAAVLVAANKSGGNVTSTNPNMKVKYQLWSRDPDTPVAEVEGSLVTAATSGNNLGTLAKLEWNDSIIVPGVEIMCSDLHLTLLGLTVFGTREGETTDRRYT